MENTLAVLALGSNIGDYTTNIQKAIREIAQECGRVRKVSSLYTTKPLPTEGNSGDDYRNLVILIETPLTPKALIGKTLEIERRLGRIREENIKWEPRTIDIDIITYGAEIIREEDLTIPHPRYHERDFVLLPLQEVAPDFRDPISNSSIQELINALPDDSRTIHSKASIEVPALRESYSKNVA